MLNSLSHFDLQQYWWLIMSLVGSILVFLLFVQGGQSLISTLGKTADERNMVVNSIGRKWEFTFTTLILFAAGMFAAFPLFYSTSFGGAYYAWKLFLIVFVIQAVSFEFRRKKGNLLGTKTYDTFLAINGYVAPFLLGAVVATFFTGSAFIRNEYNLSFWQTELYGIEILFEPTNLALGFAVLFLARILGAMYIINNTLENTIIERARKQVAINTVSFLVFFLYFVYQLLVMDGYAVDPTSNQVYLEANKYLYNFLAMPISIVLFLVGVLLVIYGIISTWFMKSTKGIWFSGLGTVCTVLAIFFVAGFNNTSFYPSFIDLQSSLTIKNASSSHYTLTAMTYISFLVPVVIAYIYFTWKAIDKHKITKEDIKEDAKHHVY